MKKQTQPALKKSAGNAKEPSKRMISKQTPTKEQLKKAIAQKRALMAKSKLPQAGDIAIISSLHLPEEVEDGSIISFAKERFETVVFSPDWYEFSVFCKILHMGKGTVGKWLSNGWIAYSNPGRIRLINRNDFEDMMRRFRKPATLWMGYLLFFGGGF